MPLIVFPRLTAHVVQAIVEGEPPNLPSQGYSSTARDFVTCCLNKNPTKRYTYSMLLNHPWIKPLTKPATIAEDVEAEDAHEQGALAAATSRLALGASGLLSDDADDEDIIDAEVAAWVRQQLERKRMEGAGMEEAQKGPKPALHAAPLDTVSPAASPDIMTAPPAAMAS
jgi:mitogen-activated protein kinase kinase